MKTATTGPKKIITTATATFILHFTDIITREPDSVSASVSGIMVFMITRITVMVIIFLFTGIPIMQGLIFSATDFILSFTIASLSELEAATFSLTSEGVIRKSGAPEAAA